MKKFFPLLLIASCAGALAYAQTTKSSEMEIVQSLVTKLTESLSNLATVYGPKAVDLTLAVYRVEALQQIAYGVLGLLVFASLYGFLKIVWAKTKEEQQKDEIRVAVIFVSFLFSVIPLIMVLELFNIYHWMAIFGYPEILIAYKTLEAAGLM